MPHTAPSFHPEEYKRRVNLLLNELSEMGLDVSPASEDDWANFVAATKAGVSFKIGLDSNGLKIQNRINFDLPDDSDLQEYANQLNSQTIVSKIVCLGGSVLFNAFYPLIPSSGESEFGIFMTYIMDDMQSVSEYIKEIAN